MELNGMERAQDIFGRIINAIKGSLEAGERNGEQNSPQFKLDSALLKALQNEQNALGRLFDAQLEGTNSQAIEELTTQYNIAKEGTDKALEMSSPLNLDDMKSWVENLRNEAVMQMDQIAQDVAAEKEIAMTPPGGGREVADGLYRDVVARSDELATRAATQTAPGMAERASAATAVANAEHAERDAAGNLLEAASNGADRETLTQLATEWREAQVATDQAIQGLKEVWPAIDDKGLLDAARKNTSTQLMNYQEMSRDWVGPETGIGAGAGVSAQLNELEVELASAAQRENMLFSLMEKAVENNNPEMFDHIKEQWEEAHARTTEIAKEIGKLDPDRAVELLGGERDAAERADVEPGELGDPAQEIEEDIDTLGSLEQGPGGRVTGGFGEIAPEPEGGVRGIGVPEDLGTRAPGSGAPADRVPGDAPGKERFEKVPDIKAKIGEMNDKREAEGMSKISQPQLDISKVQPLPGDVL